MSRTVDTVLYAELKRENGQLLVSGVVVKGTQGNNVPAESPKEDTPENSGCTGGCTVNECNCRG